MAEEMTTIDGCKIRHGDRVPSEIVEDWSRQGLIKRVKNGRGYYTKGLMLVRDRHAPGYVAINPSQARLVPMPVETLENTPAELIFSDNAKPSRL